MRVVDGGSSSHGSVGRCASTSGSRNHVGSGHGLGHGHGHSHSREIIRLITIAALAMPMKADKLQ